GNHAPFARFSKCDRRIVWKARGGPDQMGVLAMTEPIHSERLVLVPMTPPFLRASLVRNLTEAERELGMILPEEWPDGAADLLSLRLKQLEEDPAVQPWLLRAIALRDI